jgi:LmbE family N-acetylglucosaminyl deacetylase
VSGDDDRGVVITTKAPPLQPTDLGTVLSIWAHPDDETYLAGATMAEARAAGQRVVCVSATAGELGTDDPVAWPPERLGRHRRREAAAAMAVLGVVEHHVLGWPDGGLAGVPAAEGEGAVACLLDDLRPDTILTFGADGQTFHPDHMAVHRWVAVAWARRGRRERLLLSTTTPRAARLWDGHDDVFMTDERTTPTPEGQLALQVLAGGTALERKEAALAAMASQTDGLRSLVGADRYRAMVAEESFVLAR